MKMNETKQETDCCKWNQERQEKIKYGVTRVTFGMRTSCGKLMADLSTDFKFCPYCGKQIKIDSIHRKAAKID